MRQPISFTNQIVVVTGGSSGIGKQVALDLLRLGAVVTIVSENSKKLGQTYDELRAIQSSVAAIECNIRDTLQVQSMARQVLDRHGHVDLLINNAGYAVYRPFEESSIEEVLDLIDVNLSGAMRCTKVFLPSMIERRSGRIVNVSSIGGETVITPNATYCAAKHGLVAWSKAIRYELARFTIAVNVICPGHTKTDFHNHPSFRRRDPYRKPTARSLTTQVVSRGILDAIRRDRVVTYMPGWHRFVVWALNAMPFVMNPLWDRISAKRIAQLYEQIELEKQASLPAESFEGSTS